MDSEYPSIEYQCAHYLSQPYEVSLQNSELVANKDADISTRREVGRLSLTTGLIPSREDNTT